MSENYVLEMIDIVKTFNKVPVLKKAKFSLKKGEVHALVGGNGAGKSSLMKILTGVYTKESGQILINGKPVELHSASEAEMNGISMIYQEFSLIPTLTVAQNISLNRETRAGRYFIDDQDSYRKATVILKELNVNIDPNAKVESLSVGYCQMVEIAKAVSKNTRILIMDEPTSSLSEAETRSLFRLVKELKDKGISIIYITHRMAELFEICDSVTVLKDGQTIVTEDCSKITMEQVIERMLGAEAGRSFSWKGGTYNVPNIPVLKVRNLTYGLRVNNVSFELYPGEVVGLAGLMGSGRTEIAESIFGIRYPDSGEISVNEKKIANTRQAIENGIVLVPEDRRKKGLIMDHSLNSNIMLTNLKQLTKGLFVNDSAGSSLSEDYIRKLDIKTDSPRKLAKLLSGGNQQKIVLAKWLSRNPSVLILDEPTIGVDIGAKSEIVEIIRKLADRGIAVLVISSEFQELLAVSDRILVIYKGRITKCIQRTEIESEEVLQHAIQG